MAASCARLHGLSLVASTAVTGSAPVRPILSSVTPELGATDEGDYGVKTWEEGPEALQMWGGNESGPLAHH